ncbi:MAG TPA: hypothetical protein VEY91_14030 [Candidatus Limnocylindria bacterium]|nr:hypothetical protein [Candidatus Limnocylindria bacterium]
METLAIVAIFTWIAMLGFVSGACMDFGGDGEYRLRSTVASPQKTTRAYLVTYFTPGGVLGEVATEVYLLGASEMWSASHRGLLIWRSIDLDVVDVKWESERLLRVRARAEDLQESTSIAHAYARGGFTARTEVATKKTTVRTATSTTAGISTRRIPVRAKD